MGNIKTKYNKLTNTTSKYTFNSRNQLVSYKQLDDANQTTKTLSYTYDAFGRRVSKTEDGVTQKYLYDGDDIVAILDDQNQVIATITHDESIDTPLSITNANGTFYYHRDHQGSIVALTDSSGQVVERFTYDNHYGTIVNHTKTIETNNPYAYTGREYDTSELYYYRARYYDPQLQRFISEDPIGFMSGDFNWYRYVGNSPVNWIDPSGKFAIFIPILEVIIDVAIASAARAAATAAARAAAARALAKGLSKAAARAAAKAAAEAASNEPETCEQEWDRAYEICEQEMGGCNTGITGGYTNLYDCAKGLVSQRCGGNKVE